MKYKPYPYQQHAKDHILENPFCGLFLEMGLGKTGITATALHELLFDMLESEKVLIIAPKKVAESVWSDEVEKWDHLKGLKLSLVLGSEQKRKEALRAKANVYITNRENVVWLVSFYGTAWPFDTLIIDELSSFKSSKAMRFRALKKVRPLIKRVIGLTGTPAPNNLLDLWPQLYLLDRGQRLGETVTGFRTKYFKPDKQNQGIVYSYKPLKGSETQIYDSIKDICISMKNEDYLQLPQRLDINRVIHFSPETMEKYLAFERDEVLKLTELETLTVANAAALTNKLLQFTSGAVYDDKKVYHEVHSEKIDALAEDLEAANGEPVLVFYNFKHSLARLMPAFKSYKPVVLETPEDLKNWNAKKIKLLFAHPQSAGHGLNMQQGGSISIWFDLIWSAEGYLQAVARLHRQGQTRPVMNRRLIVAGTMDEDVLKALDRKISGQAALMEAVKARIEKYKI